MLLKMVKYHSFLWVSNIPLYTSIPHRLYPSISDGYLDCVHILAVINNAAMYLGVHVSFQITFEIKKILSDFSSMNLLVSLLLVCFSIYFIGV